MDTIPATETVEDIADLDACGDNLLLRELEVRSEIEKGLITEEEGRARLQADRLARFRSEMNRREIEALTRAALNPTPRPSAADRKRAQRQRAQQAAAQGHARMTAETVQSAILDVLGDTLRGGDPHGHAAVVIRAVSQVFSCPEQAGKAISARLAGRSPKIIRG